MTVDQAERGRDRHAQARVVMLVTFRAAATATALLAAYYLAPVRANTPTRSVVWLLVALGAFAVVLALQLRAIINTTHPRLRAVEALAVVVPLFLIIFARIYLTMSTFTPSAFSAELNRTGSLYFTITAFSTVGFGDIAPKTDVARLIVSVQMLVDLVIFGAIAKLLLGAVKLNIAKRSAGTPASEPAK